jgi:hypothetical protein
VPNATAIRLCRLVAHPVMPLDFPATMGVLNDNNVNSGMVVITTLKTLCKGIA